MQILNTAGSFPGQIIGHLGVDLMTIADDPPIADCGRAQYNYSDEDNIRKIELRGLEKINCPKISVGAPFGRDGRA